MTESYSQPVIGDALPDLYSEPAQTNGSAPGRIFDAGEITEQPMQGHTLAELAGMDFKRRWLIKGFWLHESHGELAGMEKSLKTWVAACMVVAVASGHKLFGKFEVRTKGPVLVFSGEVSAGFYNLQLRHIAKSMGIGDKQFENLPITIIDGKAPALTPKFQSTLKHWLNEISPTPVLVLLDPLYTYHGGAVEAGNVHATGEVLNAISEPCKRSGATLVIVNHFRKSAAGDGHLSLTDITQSGGREWVDSWILIKHRSTPKAEDIEQGDFELDLAIGGRNWGGKEIGLDFSIGQLDEETLQYVDKLKVKVVSPGSGARTKVHEFFRAQGDTPDREFSKTEVWKEIGGRKQTVFRAIEEMADPAQWWEPVRKVGEKFAWDSERAGGEVERDSDGPDAEEICIAIQDLVRENHPETLSGSQIEKLVPGEIVEIGEALKRTSTEPVWQVYAKPVGRGIRYGWIDPESESKSDG